MIEVLFGESEAASMKAAKNREVICLGFMLDIGLCHKASGACGKKKKRHIAFSDKMTLDLGGLTARIFHTVSPHSEDTVCVYVPEEGVLFLGDSTSEDFFNDGYMDKNKLHSLIQTIQSVDCEYCILSHCEPLGKEELLAYLYSLEA